MGVAIIDLPRYKTISGISSTADDAKLTHLCAAVDAGIRRFIELPAFERQTTTRYLDAPWNSQDVLHPDKPVVSITNLYLDLSGYYGQRAGGFDSVTSLLVAGEDYVLVPDQPDGSSRAGLIRSLRGQWAPPMQVRPVSSMASRLEKWPGAIKVVAVVGYAGIPVELEQAAGQIVSIMATQVKHGMPISSNSWNGYSKTLFTQMMQNGAFKNADIFRVLQHLHPTGGVVIG